MANTVYVATSLDGYIARKDGSIDWLTEIPNPEQSDYGFSDFMKRIDGIVMGRKTFELVQTFDPWPYSKPIFVLSRTLKEIPRALEGRAELLHGPLEDVLESLRARGKKHLYVDGGKTIQSFLQLDLIDELIITLIPIILGSGIPLFAEMDREIRFQLVKTETLNKDLVKNTYVRKA